MVGLTAFSKLGDLRHSFKAAPRGQGVTEYLITYSWALAIIGLIIVGLFYSGVFGTPSTPGACVAVQGYICANPVYTGNGITFTFGQNTGNGYYYGDWVFVSSDSAPVNSSQMPVELLKGMEPAATSSGNVMTPGQTIEVNFTNLQYGNITQNPSVGTALHGYVWFGFCTSEPCSEPKQIVRVASISAEASKSGTINPYGNLCSVSGNTLVCELNNQTITCSLTLQNEISGCSVPSPTTTTVTTTVYGGPTTDVHVNSTGQSGIPVTLDHSEYFTNTTAALPYPPNSVISINYTKSVYGYFGGSRANFTNSSGSTCTLNGNGTVTITPGCTIELNYAQQYEFEILEQLGSGIAQNTTQYGAVSLAGGKNVEWFSPHTNVTFSVGANPGYEFTGFVVGYGGGYAGADVQDPYRYSNSGSFSESDCYPGCSFQQSYSPSQALYAPGAATTGGCGGCGGDQAQYSVSYVPAHVNMTGAIVEVAQFSSTNNYVRAGSAQVQVSYDYQNCTYNGTVNNNNGGSSYNDQDYYYLYCNTIASGTESVPITLAAPVANWSSGFGNVRIYYFGSPESYYYYDDWCNGCSSWGISNGYSATNISVSNAYPLDLNSTESSAYASVNTQVNNYLVNNAPTGPAPSYPVHASHGTWYSYSFTYLGVTTTHYFSLPGSQEYSSWIQNGYNGQSSGSSTTQASQIDDGGYIYGLGS
jgi:hypothetical protein